MWSVSSTACGMVLRHTMHGLLSLVRQWNFIFMSKLVVLTDLGTFKAFKMEKDAFSTSPRLEVVDAWETVYGDDRISRRVSDQAGQFGKGSKGFAAINDMANGERHNIELENRRRSVREISHKLSDLLKNGEFDGCYFAASEEINKTILDSLTPEAKSKIEKNVRNNLVNAKRDDILRHFSVA